jgi:branched-chain amino acid transport system ATP-binding protein
MLSLAQAFIAKPKLLLIDELSLGLAPTVVESLLEIVRAIHQSGTTVVLVEQSVNTALKLAQRAAFMEKGEVRFEGPTKELLARPDILRAVFLQGAAAKTSRAGATPVHNGERTPRAMQKLRADILRRPVVLKTAGLSKRYGGVVAVDDVDVELHDGEILGLIGPNGAGKTTIFDLISGFTPANGGRIEFMGVDVTDWNASQRAAAGLGRSFQDARLWQALTVKEAIAVACERHVEITSPVAAIFSTPISDESEQDVDRRVEELIELLSLQAFRDKFVSELSTGSRRIVEFAAILAHEPTVVILDEPSSGIAQKETEALGPLLRQVRSHLSCSMLVIEHDMPLITSLADRMLALDTGRVIVEGTPQDVIGHAAVIESYLGAEGYADLLSPGARPRRARRKRSPARPRS